MKETPRFVPCTPAGMPVMHLEAATEAKAWANLRKAAAHMPYNSIEDFKKRGYTVEDWRKNWSEMQP